MIKDLVARIGLDNSNFVGTMKQTMGMVDDAKKGFNDLSSGLKNAVNGFKASATASNLFKIALASTGIGLIVVALGSLVAYLTTTQEGMDKLRRVTEPVTQIFQRLLGVLQNLGGNVFKGIAQMLNGELKEGFKTLADGAKQAGKETVNAFKDGVKSGKELADLNVQLQKAQINLAKQEGDIRREKAKNAEIARDQSKTEAQRQEAAKKVIELIGRETKLRQAVIDIQIKDMKIRQSANDTDTAGKLELLALENERKELDASASMERIRFNNILGRTNEKIIGQTQDLIKLQREQMNIVAIANKSTSKESRNPFSLETASKYSKETLSNIKDISNKLLGGKTSGLGVQITPEMTENLDAYTQRQKELNNQIALGATLGETLGQTFQTAFQGMLSSGEFTFKGLIQGLKAMIIKILAAVAAAFALNILLGGAGIAASSSGAAFGGMAGFKDLFSSLSGLPKFAKGGMVTGLTTAVLGDNPSGKEAVIPFERMGQFLNQFGGGNNGNQRIEIYGKIQGQDIILASNNYQQVSNKRYGF
jgi:hypothetical protein